MYCSKINTHRVLHNLLYNIICKTDTPCYVCSCYVLSTLLVNVLFCMLTFLFDLFMNLQRVLLCLHFMHYCSFNAFGIWNISFMYQKSFLYLGLSPSSAVPLVLSWKLTLKGNNSLNLESENFYRKTLPIIKICAMSVLGQSDVLSILLTMFCL